MVVCNGIKMVQARKGKNEDWPQVLAIFSACISAITGGIMFSWPSPSIPKIIEDKINYNVTLEEASYFSVLPPIGVILSSFLFSFLCDHIGRKYTLLLCAIPYAIAAILFSFAKSIYVFYLSRILSGIGDSCVFTALPAYVGEITTPKVRGTWGNMMTFSIYFGQLMVNVIGSYTSIAVASYIYLIFPIFFFCSFAFMPESPYFYLMKHRTVDAKAALQRFRNREDVDEDLEMLQKDVNRQMSESSKWEDLIHIKSNRTAILSGIFLRASQQLGGISAFVVYTQFIFQQSGSSLSPDTSAIIFVGICTFLNVCAAMILDKIGRRRSYMFSLLFCGIVLLGESAYFFVQENYAKTIDLSNFRWIPLVGMIIYVFFYSFGLGIVPTLMLGELFSASIKTKGLFILNIVFAVLVSVCTKLFQTLGSQFGLYSGFLLFSICCFASTVLSLYFVPETKGKTLEEIQQSLRSKNVQ